MPLHILPIILTQYLSSPSKTCTRKVTGRSPSTRSHAHSIHCSPSRAFVPWLRRADDSALALAADVKRWAEETRAFRKGMAGAINELELSDVNSTCR